MNKNDINLFIRNSSSAGFVRIIRGFSSTIIGQIITAISSIIMVPLFINAWGADIYGKWLTLFALVSYLTLLDLGGQNYIGNLLAQAHAKKDEVSFRDILSQSVSLFLVISFLGWLFFVSLLLISSNYLNGIPYAINFTDKLILLALGTNNLISIPAGIFVTSYRATGLLARGTMIGNIARIITLVVQILVLTFHFSPLLYSTISLIVGLALTVYLLFDSRNSIPQSRPIKINYENIKMGVPYLGSAIYFWFISISTLINLQGVITILGTNTSTTEVALYSTHRTAAGLLGYIGGFLLPPLWPELTFFHSQSRQDELTRTSLVSIKLVVAFTGLVAQGLFLLLPFVYPIWTDHKMSLNYPLLFILLAQGVLYSGWGTSSWALLASNQHKQIALWSLLNSFITIFLALIFVNLWGFLGVAIATLTGDILCGFFVFPHLAEKGLAIKASKIYIAIFRPLIAFIISSLFIFFISQFFHRSEYLISTIVLVLISIPVLYFSVGQEDFSWLYRKIRGLLFV